MYEKNLYTANNSSIIALYGDTIFKLDKSNSKIPSYHSNPKYRMPFCHQSVFVKTSMLKQYKFDTNFKICADNDFFTKIYNKGGRFWNSGIIISIYDANGISSIPSIRFCYEEIKIISKYNKFYIIIFCFKYLSMLLKYAIKRLLPKKLAMIISRSYNAKKEY
ncbi:hypothetical protein [Helicobacter sp. MIT 14-3879]|uniref:hypothetical protein n=1 Tax=Helicobacter sp. MIT 14-3879 TaxID=2040649 RepID=UPI000E1FA772|nr:hypothetical protein [Helicobacter sp. MIT 14-3879]RDU64001.1 hypothetical protein CQA44_05005 [Helicobacter sp. MIT 14-3879]